MAMFEDITKAAALGVGVGAGAALVLGGKRSREAVKRVVRVYYDVQPRLREAAAESQEQFSDLVAEVQAERSDRAQDAGEGAEAGPETSEGSNPSERGTADGNGET